MGTPQIRFKIGTDDYCLDDLQRHDLYDITAVLSNISVNRNLISPPYPFTLADADQFLKTRGTIEIKDPAGNSRPAVRAIRDRRGRYIGSIGLRPGNTDNEYEMGYYLSAAYQGRGIMTVALEKVLDSMKGALITVVAAAENPGSAKVLLKNGFKLVPDSLHTIVFPESKGGGERGHYRYQKQL